MQAVELRGKAQRYRRIVGFVGDERAIKALRETAAEYDAMADQLEATEEGKPLSRYSYLSEGS